MLVVRLRRIGKKKNPSYRIVVAEHSMPVTGQFVEDVGFYNPHTKALGLKKDEILRWLKNGAQPSNSVAKLLVKEKIKHASIVVVKHHRKPKIKEEKPVVPAESPKAEATPTSGETETSAQAPAENAEQPEVAPAEAPQA